MPTNSSSYAMAHRRARKILAERPCKHCGTRNRRIEAALDPSAPVANVRTDEKTGCAYSSDPADYMALCTTCHRKMDFVEYRPQCRKGHDYTPENTSIKPDGSRRCLTCHRKQEADRLRQPEAKAAKASSDRAYRLKNPMTEEQKARKVALQKLRRQRARDANF